eukprot:1107432-Rhodomonas_salina.1
MSYLVPGSKCAKCTASLAARDATDRVGRGGIPPERRRKRRVGGSRRKEEGGGRGGGGGGRERS